MIAALIGVNFKTRAVASEFAEGPHAVAELEEAWDHYDSEAPGWDRVILCDEELAEETCKRPREGMSALRARLAELEAEIEQAVTRAQAAVKAGKSQGTLSGYFQVVSDQGHCMDVLSITRGLFAGWADVAASLERKRDKLAELETAAQVERRKGTCAPDCGRSRFEPVDEYWLTTWDARPEADWPDGESCNAAYINFGFCPHCGWELHADGFAERGAHTATVEWIEKELQDWQEFYLRRIGDEIEVSRSDCGATPELLSRGATLRVAIDSAQEEADGDA